MAFSFSNWFKKPAGADLPDEPTADAAEHQHVAAPAAPTPAPAVPAQAQASALTASRSVKTAMPNSVRPVNLREGARPATQVVPPSVSLRGASPGGTVSARPISFPSASAVTAAVAKAPAIAEAPAASPPPPPNAGVTLALGDFVDRIPANLLRAGAPVDRNRAVIFQAQDLYSDLARGRAAVPVSTIQAVCPDLFSRPISDTEDVEISLPLSKLVEQLGAELQTRADQVAGEDVAEIETPFLQVALEDSVRLPKPPASAAPRPVAPMPPAPVTPVPPGPRRPTSRIAMGAGPGPSMLAATEPDPAAANTVRAQTPRSIHITPPRPLPGAESPAPTTGPRPPAAAPAPLMTGTPGAGVSAPTQSSVAPINPAKRPPSTVRASVAGGKIRLSGPAISARAIAPPPQPVAPPPAPVKPISAPASFPAASLPAQKKTARIQIPAIALRPNAGGINPQGAPPRPSVAIPVPKPIVPSGSPVSFRATPGQTTSPAAPTSPMPSRPARPPAPFPSVTRAPIGSLPFPPASPPAPPAGPVAPSAPTASPVVDPPASAAAPEPIIALALGPILRSLPAAMFAANLDGNAAADRVPDDVRVELPLPFIAGQLAQGRVAVPRDQFIAAMPAGFRDLLAGDGEPAEILIPLQEIFQSLPTGALSRRQDQVIDEVGPEIPTPFSMKAKEDAQRLQELAPEPEPEPELEPEPEPLPAAPVFEEAPAAVVLPEPEATLAPAPAIHESEETVALLPTALPPEPPLEETAAEIREETPADEPPRLSDVQMAPAVAPLVESEIPAAAAEAPVDLAPWSETSEPTAVTAPALADEAHLETVEPPAPGADEHMPVEPRPEMAAAATPTELTSSPAATEVEQEIPTAPEADVYGEAPAAASEAEVIVAEPTAAAQVTESETDFHADDDPAATMTEPTAETAPAPALGELAPPPEARPEPEFELDPVPAPRLSPAAVTEEVSAAAGLNGNRSEPVASQLPSSSMSVEDAQETLRAIFMVDDDLDAKKVVKLVSVLPGLKACSVMFADGLKLAGQLESVSSSEGFCAMTPPFFRRAGNYARELQLGEIQCVTLQTERTLLSFFMHGDICLSVQHAGARGFLPGVREKLLAATAELARMYALPPAHH